MPTSNHVLLYQFSDGALRRRLDTNGRRHEKCYLFIKNSYFLLPFTIRRPIHPHCSPFSVNLTDSKWKSFPFTFSPKRQILLSSFTFPTHEPSFHEILFVCRIETFFLFFYFLSLRFLFLNEKRLEINVILFNLALQTLECAGNSFALRSGNISQKNRRDFPP